MKKFSFFTNPKQFYELVNCKRIFMDPSSMSFNGSGDIEIVRPFGEYTRCYFSTANADISNNYPYKIVNSKSILNVTYYKFQSR